jgi:hypothetical protein
MADRPDLLTGDVTPDDDEPLDPAASAALIAAQRARVQEATDVDARLLFGVWGVAWLVGFGALYGWAWFLGFAGVFALAGALVRAGAEPVVVETAMTIASPIVVGVLYIAGAAMWRDRAQFALGVWILVVTIGAAAVGMPWMLAVMAIAGGGGMLVGAVADGVRRRRSAGRAGPVGIEVR